MRLTFDQQRAFEDWFRRKVEHHTCSLCQSSQWQTGDLIPAGDHFSADRPGASMVQLICRNCGHVLLFDASHIRELRGSDLTTDLM